MSNYTKSTNFTAKDSLPTGDTNKVIRGTEFDTEFDAIQTAIGTKADLAGPTFTGTATFANLTATGTVNLTGATVSNLGTVTTVDINGGTIDGAPIGANSASTGNFTTLSVNGVAITATPAELNILDGVTASTAELNILDGVTATTAELNYVDGVTSNIQTQLDAKGTASSLSDLGVTATAAELNILDGVTLSTAELNILDGVTATTAELNILDGVTATAAELNILDGKAFLDEDDLSSNSATGIPSQQSVKAYVDSQTGGGGATLSGLTDTNITSPADAALLFYDTGTSKWIDNVVSGDITIADTGVAAIGSGVIVNADINASAAISLSKTALVDGTGLTLTGDTLSVDASQTQITAVGTIATGTWQGTAIANAYVADDLTISGGTIDNSVIGGTTAAAGTFTNLTASGTFTLGGTAITATGAELNILDGVTATAAELNVLDGITATTAELNTLDGVLATAAEINLLDGATADTVVNSKAVVYGAAGQITALELDVDNIQIDANAVKSTNTNGNIELFPNGTGATVLYGNTNPGTVIFNCESNTHGVTLKGPAHSAASTYTVALPDTLGTTQASGVVTSDSSSKVKFIGTTSVAEMIEKVDIPTSTSGTINFDFLSQAVQLYNTNQTANRTINFRGDGSNTLNSIMAVGESMTAAVLMKQGSTAYYLNTYQIDGSSVTPEWQGGSAPSAGNANSIDAYVFTIIKTASSTYTVLASQGQYA